MILDEPYRWAEAVANRRDYIEDQLRSGSPVVATDYADGVLLLTLGQGQQKLFEIYDRIALAAVGHPTDIEKLRQAAIDLAHVIGFNYSKLDVTLRQIVHFGLGPAMKTSFDEIVRSPFVARLLLAELDSATGGSTYYTVDYDGTFRKSTGGAAAGGVPEGDRLMSARVEENRRLNQTLEQAAGAALRAWAIGRWVGNLKELPHEGTALDDQAAAADITGLLEKELKSLTPEVVLLDRTRPGANAFHRLPDDEAAALIAGLIA